MIQPIKPSEIPPRHGRANALVENDLREFMESSYVAVELRFPETQKPKHAYAAYHNSAVKNGYPIEIMLRSGKLYARKKTALGGGAPKGGRQK